MNDYAYRLYSKRIKDNGRVLEDMAKQAVAQAKSPDELTDRVAGLVKKANLHGEQVKRVCEMANVEMFRRMYETEEDKTFAFPLVTHEKVAAINAPRPVKKTTISKAAAVQEMATYIPGSESLEDSDLVKTAACGKTHPKKVYSEKDIIKYKSLAKRRKKKGTEKMASLSDETVASTLVMYDNGLRDLLDEVNNALERWELEKSAALADVARIGSVYLREDTPLIHLVSAMGPCELTKNATIAVLDRAEADHIRWQSGDSEPSGELSDPYGMLEAFDKYAEANIHCDDLVTLAGAIIDARLEIADNLVDIEKTAAAPKTSYGIRFFQGLGDLLFGSADPKLAAKGAKGFFEVRKAPRKKIFTKLEKQFSDVSKEDYERARQLYGPKYVAKGTVGDTGSAYGQQEVFKRVTPTYGGLVGSVQRHPLAWIAGGALAPTMYGELKSKMAENRAKATAGLGSYQPNTYGSY